MRRGTIYIFLHGGCCFDNIVCVAIGVQAMNMEWLKSVILYTLNEEGCKCKCNNWAWRFEL